MILGRIKLYLLGAAAFVGTVLGIYLKGRAAGLRDFENEQVRRRTDAMRKAKDVRDEVDNDPYFVDRARNWVRKDDDR